MGITLTERAADHVRRFLAANGDGSGLRVGVRKTGCSGWAYMVEPANEVGESDAVYESHGVRIVVRKDSLSFLEGMELDYVHEGLNEGFHFNNPNVTATCGCGSSFSVEG